MNVGHGCQHKLVRPPSLILIAASEVVTVDWGQLKGTKESWCLGVILLQQQNLELLCITMV